MIIYRALNTVNSKSYIGATKRPLSVRIAGHLKDSQTPESKFHRAIRKYGEKTFEWEVIEACDSVEQLDERERYWISSFDSRNLGYNSSEGEYLRDLGRGRKKKVRNFTNRSGIPTGEKWLIWRKERKSQGLCYCLKCYHNPVRRQFKGLCPSARQKLGLSINRKRRIRVGYIPEFRFPSGRVISGIPWWSDPSLAR